MLLMSSPLLLFFHFIYFFTYIYFVIYFTFIYACFVYCILHMYSYHESFPYENVSKSEWVKCVTFIKKIDNIIYIEHSYKTND